jgi:hypothetical protein
VGGSCSSPIYTAKCGNTVPVKFKLLCNGESLVSGPRPQIWITSCSTGKVIKDGDFHAVGQEWHFNWYTGKLKSGVYRLRVLLPDGTEKFAYVKLK